jgi:hypothetical protein
MWTGSASDLLSLCAESARNEISTGGAWANPRALAGRLRRAQTFLRTLGIEITFSREGRGGTRMIRVSTGTEATGHHRQCRFQQRLWGQPIRRFCDPKLGKARSVMTMLTVLTQTSPSVSVTRARRAPRRLRGALIFPEDCH